MRWLALGILVAAVLISGFYRARARQAGETIPRRREGTAFLLLRLGAAATFLVVLLSHVFVPERMRWASFPAPKWLPWTGVVLGVLAIASVRWVLHTLGRNVSETVLTKERHELITHGPYRWIRHPLYTTGLLLMTAIGLVVSSWAVLVLAFLAMLSMWILVIPLEERALDAKFGDDYRAYMQSTGRLLPRLKRRR